MAFDFINIIGALILALILFRMFSLIVSNRATRRAESPTLLDTRTRKDGKRIGLYQSGPLLELRELTQKGKPARLIKRGTQAETTRAARDWMISK